MNTALCVFKPNSPTAATPNERDLRLRQITPRILNFLTRLPALPPLAVTVLAFFVGFVSHASATAITTNVDLTESSYSGQFSLAGGLTAGVTYDFSNATLALDFDDAGAKINAGSPITTGYSLQSDSYGYQFAEYRVYARTSTTPYTSPQASVTADVGLDTVTGSAPETLSTSEQTGQGFDSSNSQCAYPGHPCYNTYYTYYGDSTTGYGGSFTISDVLSNSTLASLAETETLAFSFSSPTRPMFFEDATLTYTATPVPEPGSMLVLGTGLVLLLGLTFARDFRGVTDGRRSGSQGEAL